MSTISTEIGDGVGERSADAPLYGLMAEFDSTAQIMHAAERVRSEGFRWWDCHTPFPVHGLDDAMGVKMTRLPWIVLAMGLTGCGLGLLLQWWTNAYDYPYIISGKPLFSLPAFIPVTFEFTILFAAIGTVVGMLVFNNLPLHYHPLLKNERFRRVTDDKFFLVIEARDPKFSRTRTEAMLRSLGPSTVEAVEA